MWGEVLAVFALLASAAVSWRRELQQRIALAVPRPSHKLPRTVQVLDPDDCAFLSRFYRENKASWTQTYFNMLVQRWNGQDNRMASIFDKVVAVANAVEGGGGDYAITNDFFSYRAPDVIQFAIYGSYHMDCDFWKTQSSDGFNLWILIDNQGLNTTFDVLEREKNMGIYGDYDGAVASYLLPQNESDTETAFKSVRLPSQLFRRGHKDILSWRGNLMVALRQRFRRQRMKRGPFPVKDVNVSNVPLSLGEALVLREQELHRTDMHTKLQSGQFRLAAGFKLQRRNSIVRDFDFACTSQKDRFNVRQLWEQVGTQMVDVYRVPPQGKLEFLDQTGKLLALIEANSHTLLCVALAGLAFHCQGFSAKTSLAATALVAALPLLFVVYVQWSYFTAGVEAQGGEGGRLRSTVE